MNKSYFLVLIFALFFFGCPSGEPECGDSDCVTCCCDGTCSESTGRGTCSSHDGVCDEDNSQTSTMESATLSIK